LHANFGFMLIPNNNNNNNNSKNVSTAEKSYNFICNGNNDNQSKQLT